MELCWTRRPHQTVLRYGKRDLMKPIGDACCIGCGCGGMSAGDTWLGVSDLDGVFYTSRPAGEIHTRMWELIPRLLYHVKLVVMFLTNQRANT